MQKCWKIFDFCPIKIWYLYHVCVVEYMRKARRELSILSSDHNFWSGRHHVLVGDWCGKIKHTIIAILLLLPSQLSFMSTSVSKSVSGQLYITKYNTFEAKTLHWAFCSSEFPEQKKEKGIAARIGSPQSSPSKKAVTLDSKPCSGTRRTFCTFGKFV